jgi:hypothetical protein
MTFFEHSSAFIWYCDEKDCDHFAAFKPHDFRDCVDELKERGWSFGPPEPGEYGCDWTHYCPRCRRKRWKNLMDQPVLKTVKG